MSLIIIFQLESNQTKIKKDMFKLHVICVQKAFLKIDFMRF